MRRAAQDARHQTGQRHLPATDRSAPSPSRSGAVPASALRESLRVDSWVPIVPSLGKVIRRRSGSTRIAPVLKENFFTAPVFVLNGGNPSFGPLRDPFQAAAQFDKASDSWHTPLFGGLRPPRRTVCAHRDSVLASVKVVAQRLNRPTSEPC
jgi:hypothetical protein